MNEFIRADTYSAKVVRHITGFNGADMWRCNEILGLSRQGSGHRIKYTYIQVELFTLISHLRELMILKVGRPRTHSSLLNGEDLKYLLDRGIIQYNTGTLIFTITYDREAARKVINDIIQSDKEPTP